MEFMLILKSSGHGCMVIPTYNLFIAVVLIQYGSIENTDIGRMAFVFEMSLKRREQSPLADHKNLSTPPSISASKAARLPPRLLP